MWRVAAVFCCIFPCLLHAQQQQNGRQWVLVTAPGSVPVAEVVMNDARVTQDGRVANIPTIIQKEAPFRFGLLFDESGSGRRLPSHDDILQRVLDWLGEKINQQKGDGFLVGFNDQIVTSTQITNNTSQLRLALKQLRPTGGSAVRDAVIHASQKFDSVMPDPQPAGRILLLVSDGVDNASYSKERNAIESAQRSGVRVYAIGLPSSNASAGKGFLQQLAIDTGGQAFFPADANELDRALADIEGDLRGSFMVGFVPEMRDGKAHKLRFDLAKSEAHLRYATVFYTPTK